MQVSPQDDVQQTPSTQNPVWHSRPQPQVSPLFLARLGVSAVQVRVAVTSVGTSLEPSLRVPTSASTGSNAAFLQVGARANTNSKLQAAGNHG